MDIDGVVADFNAHYKKLFFRPVSEDDHFTIVQAIRQVPDFFLNLPVIPKGRELFDILKDEYTVVFLSSPMDENELCRAHKLEWIHNNFGTEYDVIFAKSKDKCKYVQDEKSILIDDYEENLKAWSDAGGTAISSNKRIDDICSAIDIALYGDKEEIKTLTEKLKSIVVDPKPTESKKKAGNYKKGEIVFKSLPIVIENVPGSIRFGFDEKGKKWCQRMKNYYGYIKRTEGADGDRIDCFIGPRLSASRVFAINQNKKNSTAFDEVKLIFGCESIDEAVELYLAHYEKGWEQNIASVIPTNTKKVRNWLKDYTRFEPYKEDIK